jgi:hypothetical protein
MDPFEGLADFVLGKLKQSAIALWLKLLFTMGLSFTVTLCFFTGTVGLKTGSLTAGFATGLVASSLVLLGLFRMSPLCKRLLIAVPTEILQAEESGNLQRVDGGK